MNSWKVVINKKNLLFVFLALISFLIAFWFDRYYIYQEKTDFIKNPFNTLTNH